MSWLPHPVSLSSLQNPPWTPHVLPHGYPEYPPSLPLPSTPLLPEAGQLPLGNTECNERISHNPIYRVPYSEAPASFSFPLPCHRPQTSMPLPMQADR